MVKVSPETLATGGTASSAQADSIMTRSDFIEIEISINIAHYVILMYKWLKPRDIEPAVRKYRKLGEGVLI